jgi:hypothetical protein
MANYNLKISTSPYSKLFNSKFNIQNSAFALCILLFSCHHAGELDVYNGCNLEGDARREDVRELNVLKNRYNFPDSLSVDHSVTLEAMLAPGYDRDRFSENKAVEITGYAAEVNVGGDETCNCHATDPADRDTHIVLVKDSASGFNKKESIVVEVTPRVRELMRRKGLDWSTDSLRSKFLYHVIKVKGWLFFDAEHIREAENTNPGGRKNWRATCWEVHPVTSIEVISNIIPFL